MALTRSLLTKQNSALKAVQSIRYFSSEIDFDKLVKNNKVVVFMKGTPNSPRCGFSNSVVQLLKLYKVEYDAHDVLSDENMRKGIKEYSSWPTIPQVFINGEFVGGSDILLQMHHEKVFEKELEKAGVKFQSFEKMQEKKKEMGKK